MAAAGHYAIVALVFTRATLRLGRNDSDCERVGAELSFGGEVNGDNWHHHGRSSRGHPIDENWIRFQP